MRLVLTTLGISLVSPPAGALLAALLALLWLAQALSRRRCQVARVRVSRAQREDFHAKLSEAELRVINLGQTVIEIDDRSH